MTDALKAWARGIKRDVVALWIAGKDPRTPLLPKVIASAIAAYASAPVDLIPDFIPVLGLLDDLLIVPLGIIIGVRLIPMPLMAEFRAKAAERLARSSSNSGLVAVVVLWISGALVGVWIISAKCFWRAH